MPLPTGQGLVDPLFLHELALELKMTIGELGDRMSARELQRWAVFFRVRAERARTQQLAEEGIQEGFPSLVPPEGTG